MPRQCPLEAVPREPRVVPGTWWDLHKYLVNKREKKSPGNEAGGRYL